jgi:hypothetical protein
MHFLFTRASGKQRLSANSVKRKSHWGERFGFVLDFKKNKLSWFEWSEPHHDVDDTGSLVRG